MIGLIYFSQFQINCLKGETLNGMFENVHDSIKLNI